MSAIINPDLSAVKQQVDVQGREIAELRGSVNQMEKYLLSVNRQSTLQIAAIVISLCLTIGGGLYFQTASIDKRFEQIEKRMDALERRMDRIERNLDELNKELRARRETKEKISLSKPLSPRIPLNASSASARPAE